LIHSTKAIDDSTPIDDISGLKLPQNKVYSQKKALKDADNGDYLHLIEMHKIIY
jgi:hypothetical protein